MKTILLFITIVLGINANAQSVACKKKIIEVNKTPYFSSDKSTFAFMYPATSTISTVDGSNKLITIIAYEYVCQEKKYNPQSNSWYMTTGSCYYYEYRFAKSGTSMFTSIKHKELFEKMVAQGVIDAPDSINEEKLKEFVASYGEDKDVILRQAR